MCQRKSVAEMSSQIYFKTRILQDVLRILIPECGQLNSTLQLLHLGNLWFVLVTPPLIATCRNNSGNYGASCEKGRLTLRDSLQHVTCFL